MNWAHFYKIMKTLVSVIKIWLIGYGWQIGYFFLENWYAWSFQIFSSVPLLTPNLSISR